MLFSSQLGMLHTAIHLLQGRFGRSQRLETALPYEGVHGQNTTVLQFDELFLERMEFLLVGRVVLLDKTHEDGHDFLLGIKNVNPLADWKWTSKLIDGCRVVRFVRDVK